MALAELQDSRRALLRDARLSRQVDGGPGHGALQAAVGGPRSGKACRLQAARSAGSTEVQQEVAACWICGADEERRSPGPGASSPCAAPRRPASDSGYGAAPTPTPTPTIYLLCTTAQCGTLYCLLGPGHDTHPPAVTPLPALRIASAL